MPKNYKWIIKKKQNNNLFNITWIPLALLFPEVEVLTGGDGGLTSSPTCNPKKDLFNLKNKI